MTDIITSQKAAYLDVLLPSLSEAVVIVDRQGIVRGINAAFTEILGHPEQEIVGKPFSVVSYLRDVQHQFTAHNPLHRFFSAEQSSIEIMLFDRNGLQQPVRFRSALIKDELGNVTEAIGIIERLSQSDDETASGKLAEKMWEAQQNFENVLNFSTDIIAICDISGNIMTVNNAFLNLLGYSLDEAVGRHIVEFTAFREGDYPCTTGETVTIDAAYIKTMPLYIIQLFEHGKVNYEAHMVTKNGVLLPLDISISLLKDKEGERRGSLVIARDITKRTVADRDLAAKTLELQQAKDQIERLIDASIDPIVIGDRDGRIVKANRAFLDLVGAEENEIIGATMHQFSPGQGIFTSTTNEQIQIAEDFYEDAAARITELFETNRMINWKSWVVNRQGKIIPVLQNVILLRSDDGGVTASLGIIRDITEQRKNELALTAAKEAAEAANQAKSIFLANMSHEIRTPMNGVIGFTDMLLDTPLDDEQKDFAQSIKRSGEALLSLINDILDFSKIEAGRIQLEEIEFDIEMLAYDACEMVRPRIAGKEVELLCRIGDDVPALVKGDPHRLRQVVLNLLGNAGKFTDRGEIELCLSVDEERADRALVHMHVRDTGIGIPQDKLETIFELFQQADSSTTRKYGGTGLGLSICRRIATLMGGWCWAESLPGEGSTFHFTAWLGTKTETKQVKRIPPVALKGKRVVITDDNRSNLEILSHILQAAGMEVTGFTDGVETLAAVTRMAAAGNPFDICVLDVRMPGMSGYEVARRIRTALGEGLPLLAFTSSTEDGVRKCYASGFNGFLPKPIKRIKLYKMIERLLGEAQSKPEAQAETLPRFMTQHSMREEAKLSASILLAEDNPVNQKLGVKLLTKAGYAVDVADNGGAAVAKFSAAPDKYDIILMDVQMPEMNGLDATRALRQQGFTDIPIVAMTANAMEGDREKCLEAGMNDYIPKPIKREVVFEMLKKWVFERL